MIWYAEDASIGYEPGEETSLLVEAYLVAVDEQITRLLVHAAERPIGVLGMPLGTKLGLLLQGCRECEMPEETTRVLDCTFRLARMTNGKPITPLASCVSQCLDALSGELPWLSEARLRAMFGGNEGLSEVFDLLLAYISAWVTKLISEDIS